MILFVFGLGLRHGLDLDHLALIDSITRSARTNKLAKRVGVLFSLGHGLVVIVLSAVLGRGLIHAKAPLELESIGNGISIFFLLFFGLLTLRKTVFPKKNNLPFRAENFLAKYLKHYNSVGIMLVGAMFAISFDTVTQVALLSLSTTSPAHWLFSIALGFTFMIGMIASDGLNGLIMAILINRANKTSSFLSRLFGLLIAFFSLGLGLFNWLR